LYCCSSPYSNRDIFNNEYKSDGDSPSQQIRGNTKKMYNNIRKPINLSSDQLICRTQVFKEDQPRTILVTFWSSGFVGTVKYKSLLSGDRRQLMTIAHLTL